MKAADEGLFLAKRSGRNCVASTNSKARPAEPAEREHERAGQGLGRDAVTAALRCPMEMRPGIADNIEME